MVTSIHDDASSTSNDDAVAVVLPAAVALPGVARTSEDVSARAPVRDAEASPPPSRAPTARTVQDRPVYPTPLSEADAVERTPVTRHRPVGALTAARPPVRREPLSPFVAWSPDADAELEAVALEEVRRAPNLLVEIVTNPDAFAERILDGRALQSSIVTALSAAIAGTAAFAALVRFDEGPLVAALSGGRLALSVLLAVAAAIGPIHAAGVLVAARVPLARLVAVMLSATAAGALVLAPLGPVVRLLHHRDAMWLGPLALVGTFFIAAAFAGVTLRRVLHALARAMARTSDRRVTANDLFRVGIVSRMALVFLGFTSMLALWGLGAFT